MAKKSIFNIFNRKKNVPENVPQTEKRRKSNFGILSYSSGSTFIESDAMSLSAVYRCVSLISDSIAQLSVEVCKVDKNGFKTVAYNHPLSKILDKTPNKRMTRFHFLQTIIRSMLLRGDGFAYIERNTKGDIVALHYIPSEYVTVIEPKYLQDAPTYNITGMMDEIPDTDMIHLFNYTDDGINGISVLTNARKVLELSWSTVESANLLYENGGNLFGILKSEMPLRDEQRDEIYKQFNDAKSGKGKISGAVLLDQGFSYERIGVSAVDQDLLSAMKWNVAEIARVFGIPLSRLMIDSSSSYGSLEQENLNFLASLQAWIERIQDEFTRKLCKDNYVVRLNTTELMKSDMGSLANYLSKNLMYGVMTHNECRSILNLPSIDNGDEAFVPSNLMPLKNAVNNKPADNKIDNSKETIDVVKEEKKEE